MADASAVLLAVASTLVASAGMLLFKIASGERKIFLSKYFFAGGLLLVLGTVLMILALKIEELSVLFPITALTYIWVMILARIFLREKLNRWKLVSIVLIVAGIVFVMQ